MIPCNSVIDWITLDEAEPRPFQRCLIAIPASAEFKKRIRIADYEGCGSFRIIGTGVLADPSHWSPMPEFPDDGEEAEG